MKSRDATGKIITKETHCHKHKLFLKPCFICKLESLLRRLKAK